MIMETSKIHVLTPSHADGEEFERSADGCATLRAISDVLAIFAAIDHGELLAVLPEAPADRVRFQAAISLLGIRRCARASNLVATSWSAAESQGGGIRLAAQGKSTADCSTSVRANERSERTTACYVC
jgi:hypothetical protein